MYVCMYVCMYVRGGRGNVCMYVCTGLLVLMYVCTGDGVDVCMYRVV